MATLPGYIIQYKGKNREVITPAGEIISYGAYRNIVSRQKGFESRYAETKANKPIEYYSKRDEKQVAYDIGKPKDIYKVIRPISDKYSRNTGIAIGLQYSVIDSQGKEHINTIQSSMTQNTRGNIPRMIDELEIVAQQYEIVKLLRYFVIMYPERQL